MKQYHLRLVYLQYCHTDIFLLDQLAVHDELYRASQSDNPVQEVVQLTTSLRDMLIRKRKTEQ